MPLDSEDYELLKEIRDHLGDLLGPLVRIATALEGIEGLLEEQLPSH